MRTPLRSLRCVLFLSMVVAASRATSLSALSFEELADTSDVIVAGRVTRTWCAWDAGHKYIWTHYEVAVSATPKGIRAHTLEIAEPGGIVDGIGMTIAGSVGYKTGENVVVFAQRMPNGYMRTTGWGQGRFSIRPGGLLHPNGTLQNAEPISAGTDKPNTTPVRSLEGISLNELSARIAARTRSVNASKGIH